jgi:hypothetical protein
MRVDLSPKEWEQFSREAAERAQSREGEYDPDECVLQICCANISNFRDVVLEIGANDGEVTDALKRELEERWQYLKSSHGSDEPWTQHPTIQKFLQQTGLQW